MKRISNGFVSVLVVIVLLILISIGYFIYDEGIFHKDSFSEKVIEPTSIISLTPTPELPVEGEIILNKVTGLKTFTSRKYKYSFSFSSKLFLDTADNGLITGRNMSLSVHDSNTGMPDLPQFHIEVAINGEYLYWRGQSFPQVAEQNGLWSIPVGSQMIRKTAGNITETYTRLSDISVGGEIGKRFKGTDDFYKGEDIIVFVSRSGLAYMIGTYDIVYNRLDDFYEILRTFKFID